MNNREFWDRVKKTDPRRVKQITGKQYKGNSPQPYYLVERMTEEFGMCGLGWGLNIKNERMERMSEHDILHVAVVELWYRHDGETGRIEQIGQTKAAYMSSKGTLVVDEDAPKKSVTDAMTKCMSYLGFSGDIFSGHWDDSKYVQALTEEFLKGEADKQRKEDLAEAAQQIKAADSLESLKDVFAGWYRHFANDAEAQTQAKAEYDQRKNELEPQKEEA